MNINQIMKQAQVMQKKMTEMQEKIAGEEFTGTSGGGLVNITINGKNTVQKITIDQSLIIPEDKEMLEDLIVAAFNDARKKLDNASEGEMSGMFGGMSMPAGFKMPF